MDSSIKVDKNDYDEMYNILDALEEEIKKIFNIDLLSTIALFKKRYEVSGDLADAARIIEICSQSDLFIVKGIDLGWVAEAIYLRTEKQSQKGTLRRNIGSLALSLVKNGHSINKTKLFLQEWFNVSATYVRTAYYDAKKLDDDWKDDLFSFTKKNIAHVSTFFFIKDHINILSKDKEFRSTLLKMLSRPRQY